MDLLALITYGAVTYAMVLTCFFGAKGKYYEFPFWAGIISAGWFLPQAMNALSMAGTFPDGSYSVGMFFAALCNAMAWLGFSLGMNRPVNPSCWLADNFNTDKLFYAGAAMCTFGFFFQYKLQVLGAETDAGSQWSGAMVKYLFFASVFKLGFVALWLLYLFERKLFNWRLLVFIIPSMFLLLQFIVLHGRRGVMMNFFAYIFGGLWLVRRKVIPRPMLIGGVMAGLVLINSIGIYRAMMRDKDVPVGERFSEAVKAVSEQEETSATVGGEFKNYIYSVALYKDYKCYDFGGFHWNELVFAYVPGQIVGREFKKALMLKAGLSAREVGPVLYQKFGYQKSLGTTISGYADSFGSYSWFGAVKFLLIGLMMGTLYRYAMAGTFLGQMLYTYMLGTAMHAITHGTNRILSSVWVYFFVLAYPLLFCARIPRRQTDG